jgi:2-phosphosulfolactate phosphatase
MFTDQADFEVACEWGLEGLRAVGGGADVIVIVDVLSFTTCVDIAVSRGAAVYPYLWKDASAVEYAARVGAELAGSRRSAEQAEFTLSPRSMLKAGPGTKIVLPSPNGSAITTEAARMGKPVLAGCLRNGRAVARLAASLGRHVAVIPAGEKWPDGSLRAAIEDLAAAGAIIAALSGTRSPEAAAAVGAWHAIGKDIERMLPACSSGRELVERGFQGDVRLACQFDVSDAAPLLRDGAYCR